MQNEQVKQFLESINVLEWNKIKEYLCVAPLAIKDRDMNVPKINIAGDIKMSAAIIKDIGGDFIKVYVNKQMMESWGKTIEEVVGYCLENNQEYNIRQLGEVIEQFIGDDILSDDDNPSKSIYICTNQTGFCGASCLADTVTLNTISRILGPEYIIIPSSIHEILALKGAENDFSDITNMIRNINTTVVASCDRLSDHPYRYTNGKVEPIFA